MEGTNSLCNYSTTAVLTHLKVNVLHKLSLSLINSLFLVKTHHLKVH